MEYNLYDYSDRRLYNILTKKIKDYPFIKTIKNDNISVYDVLKVNDIFYSVQITQGCDIGLVKLETLELDNVESNYESEITCPICGCQEQDSWEYKSDCDEYECGCCGAVLEYNREVTVEYRTIVKEKPEVKEI